MPTKKSDGALDLFDARGAKPGETKVWEFPKKLDWGNARVGDLVQFPQIRHWDSPATEPVYLEAVGRIRSKGETADTHKPFVEVEIIWDENIPRLRPDWRIFVLDH